MIPEIDVKELAARLAAGETLIDVREPDEYVEVHVPGAYSFPLSTLQDQAEQLPEGPLVLICRSGARSMRAAQFLHGNGRDVINVAGGTLAWIESGQPAVVGSERG